MSHRTSALSSALALTLAIAACSDTSTSPAPDDARSAAVKFWEAGSSVYWNQAARDLITARGGGTPGSQSRILTYLSVAQYNAIIAAEGEKDRGEHASPAAAAAGASVVVLKRFFPLDAASIDATLLAQRAGERSPVDRHRSFAAGEAIGRSTGALVVAYAAGDGINLTPLPANPGGAGSWTGVNAALGFYGARTFALTSGDQFRPPPPPAFGSAEFNVALAEVRAVSDALTAPQLAIAQFWNDRGPAYLNGVAAEMIVAHRRSEREAARILALSNMAGFDVLNACFDAKLTYYLIRPSQADPLINLPVGLPNHPSYPSGHSCITGAYATVLESAFPEGAGQFREMVEEAGVARIYGGLHYRFDLLAGRELGRQVAEQVLRVAVGPHSAIPLD